MEKRVHFLQICFICLFLILLGKLAYEQLYRSALLTGTLSADSSFIQGIQYLINRIQSVLNAVWFPNK